MQLQSLVLHCIIYIAFSIYTAEGIDVVEGFGCAEYEALVSYHVARQLEDCMFENVDILPFMHFQKFDISTPTLCKQKCQETEGCAYFTHVTYWSVNPPESQTQCFLKEKPSKSTSPVFGVRKYEGSKHHYVSGAVDGCKHKCQDDGELYPGCGASSPVTCKYSKAYYTPGCIEGETKLQCLSMLYGCCSVDPPREDTYAYEKLLIGGETVASYSQGIYSPEECKTLCLSAEACTDWNFVESPQTKYIGGACYLRQYTLQGKRFLIPAPAYVKSASQYKCNNVGQCNTYVDTIDEQLEGDPIADTCFKRGRVLQDVLTIYYSGFTKDTECQLKCQETDGCKYFSWTGTACYLAYTAASESSQGSMSVSGPKYCDKEPDSDGCYNIHQIMEGKVRKYHEVATAAACSALARADKDARGWYRLKDHTCYGVIDFMGFKESYGAISGYIDCYISPAAI